MKVTILGCGGSGGVPLITGAWGECDPANPKNRRLRASIAVEHKGTTLIIDTSPDLRAQCLAADIRHVDAVLYTHDHADHTHGIDDLRTFVQVQQKPLPMYGDAPTLAFLKKRFGYIFDVGSDQPNIYKTVAIPHLIEGNFQIGEIEIQPFTQGHGGRTSLGYRFGKIAYSTDVVELDETAFKALEGIEVWIVDCIALDPRPSHSHLAQTLEWIERVKPKRAYLTHMSPLLDYDKLMAMLPEGVEPAYDGLVIKV